jgi:ABC-2 type transport system ATP-binding protein
MIEVDQLSMTYRVPVRASGLGAAFQSLFKREFRSVEALHALSFQVGAGEIVGFLGPNGAGKTTTLKILSGILHPSAGSAKVMCRGSVRTAFCVRSRWCAAVARSVCRAN